MWLAGGPLDGRRLHCTPFLLLTFRAMLLIPQKSNKCTNNVGGTWKETNKC